MVIFKFRLILKVQDENLQQGVGAGLLASWEPRGAACSLCVCVGGGHNCTDTPPCSRRPTGGVQVQFWHLKQILNQALS